MYFERTDLSIVGLNRIMVFTLTDDLGRSNNRHCVVCGSVLMASEEGQIPSEL